MKLALSVLSRFLIVGDGEDDAVGTAGGKEIGKDEDVWVIPGVYSGQSVGVGTGGGEDGMGSCS